MKKVIFLLPVLVLCVPISAHFFKQKDVGVQAKKQPSRAIYCVILAGGTGERLWPLSRKHKPKQLLEVGDQKTLLDQAIERLKPITSPENIWICTTSQHAQSIQSLTVNSIGHIVVEPGARNTGPAILLSCLEIYEKDPQALVLFLPADPFIPPHDYKLFADYLDHAFDFVGQEDRITLLGVKPTFAATGYGYIEFEQKGFAPYSVAKFHEKPSKSIAEQYVASPNMLWNIGMFCAKVNVFIDEFKQVAPAMYDGVVGYRTGSNSYNSIVSDSVDYAVMEKSKRISVLPVDFSWCDVGNIEIFLSIKEQYGALNNKKLLEVESSNNLVDVEDKLVALIGVQDLCIVQTDQVLLVTKREDSEKVRAIVKMLKQGAFADYL